jgi:protein-S-isoprenylcysteine O-methyltransferase Ste14
MASRFFIWRSSCWAAPGVWDERQASICRLPSNFALRYDIGRLAGLTQIRIGQRQIPDGPDELFVVTGLHRYVRHPLYSASILFLMGGATSLLGLTTAIFATSYFVIGMKFEDRKLARLYGDIYRDYRQRTPALIPFWRP